MTLNPLESQLARDLFRAGCQHLADLEIAAAQHAGGIARGWPASETDAALRVAALDLARAWADWLPLVDYPRLLRSPLWGQLIGERGRNFAHMGEPAAVLVEAAIKYAAGGGLSMPLEQAAVAYGDALFTITRGPGWKVDMRAEWEAKVRAIVAAAESEATGAGSST